LARQVARADLVVEHDVVADAQLRQRLRGGEGLKQLTARVDRVGDRHKVRIELARGDRVKELSLGVLQPPGSLSAPQKRLGIILRSNGHSRILAAASDGRSVEQTSPAIELSIISTASS